VQGQTVKGQANKVRLHVQLESAKLRTSYLGANMGTNPQPEGHKMVAMAEMPK